MNELHHSCVVKVVEDSGITALIGFTFSSIFRIPTSIPLLYKHILTKNFQPGLNPKRLENYTNFIMAPIFTKIMKTTFRFGKWGFFFSIGLCVFSYLKGNSRDDPFNAVLAAGLASYALHAPYEIFRRKKHFRFFLRGVFFMGLLEIGMVHATYFFSEEDITPELKQKDIEGESPTWIPPGVEPHDVLEEWYRKSKIWEPLDIKITQEHSKKKIARNYHKFFGDLLNEEERKQIFK
jgi:hypothetical protein